MSQAVDQTIVESYARIFSIEDLDAGILELATAFRTSQFSNISVLGMSTGQNGDQATIVFKTFELARKLKLSQDPDTGEEATNIALDAKSPLGVGFDFSCRQIE